MMPSSRLLKAPDPSAQKASVCSLDTDNDSSSRDLTELEAGDTVTTEEMPRTSTIQKQSCPKRPLLSLTVAILAITGFACFAGIYLTRGKNESLGAASPGSSPDDSPRSPRTPVCMAAQDLHHAVDLYLSDPSPDAEVSLKYGYPIGTWCFSGTTDFESLFSAHRNPAAATFNEDVSSWDMSWATNLDSMFEGAAAFNQDLTSWETSRVTSIKSIFRNAHSFNGDVSTWNTTSLVDMREAFRGATSFNQDLSLWKTSSVENMRGTFMFATSFNLSLHTWDVSKVESMRSMFNGASSFNQDLGTWDVSSVVHMAGMFEDAVSFNGDVTSWDVSSVVDLQGLFRNAESFNQDISSWPVSAILYTRMFENAASFDQNLCAWRDSIQGSDAGQEEITFLLMFSNTACPDQSDPILTPDSTLSGSLCHTCTE